jgi:predicted enzyme related to lactoylglutathione lyase
MSHRSRLTAVLVDVPAADHDRAVSFWSAALGVEGKRLEKHPEYAFYGEVTPGIEFMVQATGAAAARVHFDIETDDIDAEVQRLVDIGATEVERIESWVVMRDPSGVLFCVVKVQVQESFDKHARTWD